MRNTKRGFAVLLALVCLLAGCKTPKPTVDIGAFTLSMPGEITRNTYQLSVMDMGLSANTPLVLTSVEAQPPGEEVYMVICVDWEQTLAALQASQGEGWNQQVVMDTIRQSAMDLLGISGQEGAIGEITVAGMTGTRLPYQLTATDEGGAEYTGQGQMVTFMDQQRMILLLYFARQDLYSQKNADTFFQSLNMHP